MLLRLSDHSALWHAVEPRVSIDGEAGAGSSSTSGSATSGSASNVVLFNSVLATDGGKMTPQVQVASFVSKGAISAVAHFDAPALMRNAERVTFTVPLGEYGHNAFRRDGHAWMEKMRRKVSRVSSY